MQKSPTGRGRKILGLTAAAIVAIFGVVSVVQGLNGRSTVTDALTQEAVVGQPHMNPAAIAASAKKAGLSVDTPTCSVAGKPIDNGADARCFAEYMRVDALMATGGKTYAQMPRFATEDGKGTNIEAQAMTGPDGRPVNNPARNVWVTETALSTALNTSYMAEQVALFGIAVGAMFLLVGLVIAAAALGSVRVPKLAGARRPATEGALS